MNTLLPRTLCFKHKLCSLEHFTPQHIFHPEKFCFSTQFAPWNNLLAGILCSSTHSVPWHTLLLRTFCSSAHFASFVSWNSLLPGTVCFLENFAPLITRKTVSRFGVKCSWEQSVPGSKLCWGVKRSKEQSVCLKQSVLGSKVFISHSTLTGNINDQHFCAFWESCCNLQSLSNIQ